jgi:hypothetical protein
VPSIARLHEVESLYYGVKEGRISIARTLTAVADFAAVLRRPIGPTRTTFPPTWGRNGSRLGADHKIGDCAMEQVVRLLDAPELGPN